MAGWPCCCATPTTVPYRDPRAQALLDHHRHSSAISTKSFCFTRARPAHRPPPHQRAGTTPRPPRARRTHHLLSQCYGVGGATEQRGGPHQRAPGSLQRMRTPPPPPPPSPPAARAPAPPQPPRSAARHGAGAARKKPALRGLRGLGLASSHAPNIVEPVPSMSSMMSTRDPAASPSSCISSLSFPKQADFPPAFSLKSTPTLLPAARDAA